MPDASTRLNDPEALALYRGLSLHELGARAHAACCAKHPTDVRTYVVDRNINYSNVCDARCAFCAYHADAAGQRPWTATNEEILEKVGQLVAIGGCQILLQGGLHPELPLGWYERLLGDVGAAYPSIHVHGFSAAEIVYLARREGMSIRDLLARLQAAGLATIPGAAEVLVDRVRRRVSPNKCTTQQWLDVMRQAHALGMRTTATLMFGHVETDAERVEHLRRIRELQDESLDRGKGHFTAFIPWTFQPANTALAAALPEYDPEGGAPFDGQSLRLAGAHDYLRTLALARLYLDNVENLQASWVTQGPKIGQLALFYGANDLGSVMMEERVVSAAGTAYDLDEAQIRRLIETAGFAPRRRNCYYELL